MNYKIIISVFILTVVFISALTSVCAGDVNDTDEIIGENNIEEKLNVADNGSFTALQDKINVADENSTIELENNYMYNTGFDNNGILISKSVIIDGKGHSINADGKSRIFQINNNSHVTLLNLTFINAQIEGSANTGGGGAIFNNNANLIIKNSIFKNNTVLKFFGAGIYSKGNLTVIDSVFDNNNASWGGGGIYNEGNMEIINSTFKNNYAGLYGGAVTNYHGFLKISNSTFNNNTAMIWGGAVNGEDGNLTIFNTTFTNHFVKEYGGVIHYSATNFTLTHSRLINTTALHAYNDAISLDDFNYTVKNNTFINSTFFGVILDETNIIINPLRFEITTVIDRDLKICVVEVNNAYRFNDNVVITLKGKNYTVNLVNGCGMSEALNPVLNPGKYNITLYYKGNYIRPSLTKDFEITVVEDNSFSNLKNLIDYNIHKNNYNIILHEDFIYSSSDNLVEGIVFESNKLLSRNVCIDGNGHTIDGNGITGVFQFKDMNVTIKNLKINNGTCDYGSVLVYKSQLTVVNSTFNNCNSNNGGAAILIEYGRVMIINSSFSNNTAGYGGALFAQDADLTIINSIFNNNTGYAGGAIVQINKNMNVYNSRFINNTAEIGGAIYNGYAVNCIFENNHANSSGAIYNGTADSCIFKTSEDTTLNTTIYAPVLTINDYIFSYNTGEIEFNLTTHSGSPITDANITIITYDGVMYKNYTLSNKNPWKVDLPAGYYTVQYKTGYEGFTPVNKTITITQPTQIHITPETYTLEVNNTIKLNAILQPNTTLSDKLTYKSNNENIVKMENNTIIGICEGTTTITVSFAGYGVYEPALNKTVTVTVTLKPATVKINQTTIDLHVGETLMINTTTNPEDLDLTYHSSDENIVIINSNGKLTGIKPGSAIITVKIKGSGVYFENSTTVNVTVSLNDASVTADYTTLNLSIGENKLVHATTNPYGLNVTYKSNNHSIILVDNGYVYAVGTGNALITVKITGNGVYYENTTTINVTVTKKPTQITLNGINMNMAEKLKLNYILTPDIDNLTFTSNNPDIVKIDLNGQLTALNAGLAIITITYPGNNIYNSSKTTINVTVNKINTQIIASQLTTTYGMDGKLIITLKDITGNPVMNTNLTVNLNGVKTLTTDNNGQVQISTLGLTPNTYKADIVFDGNNNYINSNSSVNVIVKKATPKLIAGAKTFKVKVKTKKYTVILKDNNAKPLKNAKITLNVKGKTYRATTDAAGKATFKITNLKKKGKYMAKITFNGDVYFNMISVSVKIKVK